MVATNEKLKLLLNSTAVVIDDEIESEGTQINILIKELEKHGTLFVKLPEINVQSIEAFSNTAFIILDWEFNEEKYELPEGVSLGSEFVENTHDKTVDFIKQVTSKYYLPILIFSQQSCSNIKSRLENNEYLKHCIETGRIGIFHKQDLIPDKVVEYLDDWLTNNLSAHLFIHLRNIMGDTQHQFYNEFDGCSVDWPNHVYNNLKQDNPVDINQEFQEFILTALASRVSPTKFDATFKDIAGLSRDEILKIYSCIKFIKYDTKQQIGVGSGDLYRLVNSDGSFCNKYMLNITAPCDLRKEKMLFLRGQAFNDNVEFDYKDKVCEHSIYQICDNDCIRFKFDTFERIKVKNDGAMITIDKTKTQAETWKRIGRVVHPYITNIQDRFSHYIVRRGVTRTPNYNN